MKRLLLLLLAPKTQLDRYTFLKSPSFHKKGEQRAYSALRPHRPMAFKMGSFHDRFVSGPNGYPVAAAAMHTTDERGLGTVPFLVALVKTRAQEKSSSPFFGEKTTLWRGHSTLLLSEYCYWERTNGCVTYERWRLKISKLDLSSENNVTPVSFPHVT